MCYVFYTIALLVGLIYPTILCASQAGLGVGALWDTISLLLTIVGSFFLVATASGTLSFYKNDKYLEMWGDLALKMGYIGSLLGIVFILGGMAQPAQPGVDPAAKLGASLAVALITVLYGLIFKYMVITPWLGCRQK